MKIICRKENEYQLNRLLKEYKFLDLVVVEKGLDYVGLCYYFSMNDIDSLVDYLKELTSQGQWLVGVYNDTLEKVSIHKIIYIEGFSKEAYFYTKDKEYVIKDKLYELEEKLKPYGFIRINKSIIININEIKYIIPEIYSRYSIYMNNDIVLVLSRNYVKGFKERLGMR